MTRAIKRTVILTISLYQKTISSFLPSACRYTPTCSHYSQEAVERYGTLRGIWMGLGRLGRCQPFGGKGYDPVP